MNHWITDSQDEQCIEDLFRDADQVHIPIFQREYVWKQKEFDHLLHDIGLIKDSLENSQFLGAVVTYERPRESGIVGRLRALDIVDGQQRLLTLYIFILGIAERMHFYDKDIASEIIQEFLLLPERRGLSVNTRIVPSFKDRSQFRSIWDRVNSPESMKEILASNPPKPPLPSGNQVGSLTKQYERVIRWLKKTSPSEPQNAIEYLNETLETITSQLTFVHLKLTDAAVATKIFERLNYRGVKVGVVDLVRNEIFSRMSQDPEKSMEVYETIWRPFEAKFNGREDGFFFPYALIHNSLTKKSELFSELRKIWKGLSPTEIIDHMVPYQKHYIALILGTPTFHNPKLNLQIKRLHKLRVPSATYPFIIQILLAVDRKNLDFKNGYRILELVESFLVRRSILGFEPTGLHALFKGLWEDIKGAPNRDSFKVEIFKKSTIQYPTDKEVMEAIKKRPLYKSKICSFLLREYDISLEGDSPLEDFTIEHVLPNTWVDNDHWSTIFTKEKHRELKDTLANLVALSEPLNKAVQRDPYKNKRTKFAKESMFISARKFAEDWETWNESTLKNRAEILGNWANKRWKK